MPPPRPVLAIARHSPSPLPRCIRASSARKANCRASTRRRCNLKFKPKRGSKIRMPVTAMPNAISRLPLPKVLVSAPDQARDTVASGEMLKRESSETTPKTSRTTAAISPPQGGTLSRNLSMKPDWRLSSTVAGRSCSRMSGGDASSPPGCRLTVNLHCGRRICRCGVGRSQAAQPATSIELAPVAVNSCGTAAPGRAATTPRLQWRPAACGTGLPR